MADTMSTNPCRICMGSKMNQSSIFSNDLSRKVTEIADVEVQEGDGLPPTICKDCELDLEKCYKFREQIQWADSKFRENISATEVVFEECQIKQEVGPMHPFINEEDNQDLNDEDDDDDRGPSDNDEDYEMQEEPEDKTERAEKERNEATHPLDHVEIIEHRTKQEIHMSSTDQNSQDEPLIVTQNMKNENEPTTDPLMHNETQSMETDNSVPGPSTSTPMVSDLCKNTASPGIGQNFKTCKKLTDLNLQDLLKLPKKKNWTIVVRAEPLQNAQGTNTCVFSSSHQDDHNQDNVLNIETSSTNESTSTINHINPLQKQSVQKKNLLHAFLNQTPTQNQTDELVTNSPEPVTVVPNSLEPVTFVPYSLEPVTFVNPFDVVIDDGTIESTELIDYINEEEIVYTEFEPNESSEFTTEIVSSELIDFMDVEEEIINKEFKSNQTPTITTEIRVLGTNVGKEIQNGSCNEDGTNPNITKNHDNSCDNTEAYSNSEDIRNTVSVEERFKCIVCKKEFSSNSHLDVHLKNNHLAFEYIQCSACNYMYLGPYKLSLHVASVHLNTSVNLTCAICGKILKDESCLRAHVETHMEPCTDSSLCDLCGKMIKNQKMKSHVQEMHPKKPLECPHCGETFHTRSRLQTHKRNNHVNPAHYELCCEICGKKCKGTRLLKRHQSSHSDERNFTCDTCGITFKQYSTLAAHRRVHTGVLPYLCRKCGKAFCWKKTKDNHESKCQGLEDKFGSSS